MSKTTEFLQQRLDWTQEPGRGERLPAGDFDFATANHYKILYRTFDFLLNGWDHWFGTEDEVPTLEKARDFLSQVHPYFAWAVQNEQLEFDRLFWFYYELQDWELPPDELERRRLEEERARPEREARAALEAAREEERKKFLDPQNPPPDLAEPGRWVWSTRDIRWNETGMWRWVTAPAKPKSLDSTRARIEARAASMPYTSTDRGYWDEIGRAVRKEEDLLTPELVEVDLTS